MKDLLERLLNSETLDEADASALLRRLAATGDDAVPPAQAGAVLAALRMRGETAAEVRGMARAMREMATPPGFALPEGACDIVGTGGDNAHTFNLSTGSALLAAAAGVPVVKHGGRSVSSSSGAADVLAALGLPVPIPADAQPRVLARTGFIFLFAPAHHPAMASIGPVRRSMGVRTVFNILGPLTNPASPPFSVIGAASEATAALIAQALAGLPLRRAFVVHGALGWDEPTPIGPFTLFDVKPGAVSRQTRDPLDLGLPRCGAESLRGGDPAHNAAALRRALTTEPGPHRDALRLGAALALEVTGACDNAPAALARATNAIESGAAGRLLDDLAEVGRG